MNNKYLELKRDHEKAINNFPMFFAFSDEQFIKGMLKLGLNPDETDKIYKIGAGGYIKKSDSKALNELFNKIENDIKNRIDNDTTGEGFILDMFYYELNNHEYIITRDISDTLNCLDLKMEDIKRNKNLLNGLNLALKMIDNDDY